MHTGTCCAFPTSPAGQEVFVKPETEAGRTFDTIRDNTQRPTADVEALAKLVHDQRYRGVFKDRTAHFLKQLQDTAVEEEVDLAYPSDEPDVLFHHRYRHKHRGPRIRCVCRWDAFPDSYTLCNEAIFFNCGELGCDPRGVVARRRLAVQLPLGGPKPEWHVAPVVSQYSERMFGLALKESWDRLRGEGLVVGLDSEGAEAWSQVPSILVKGVFKYLDYHHLGEHEWGNYVMAMAAAATKAILEQYELVRKVTCTSLSKLQNASPFLRE